MGNEFPQSVNAEQVFEAARSNHNGVIDKDALQHELKNFTVDDWRRVIALYPYSPNNPDAENVQIGGVDMLSRLGIEEKGMEFLVHNDPNQLNNQRSMAEFTSFLHATGETALGAAIGLGLSVFRNQSLWTIGIGAAVGLGVSLLEGHHRSAEVEKRIKEADPLHVPLDSLLPNKISSLESQLAQVNKVLGLSA